MMTMIKMTTVGMMTTPMTAIHWGWGRFWWGKKKNIEQIYNHAERGHRSPRLLDPSYYWLCINFFFESNTLRWIFQSPPLWPEKGFSYSCMNMVDITKKSLNSEQLFPDNSWQWLVNISQFSKWHGHVISCTQVSKQLLSIWHCIIINFLCQWGPWPTFWSFLFTGFYWH